MRKKMGLICALISVGLLGAGCAVMMSGTDMAARWLFGLAALAMIGAMLLRGEKASVSERAKGGMSVEDRSGGGCTFQDVAANDSARESLRELVDFLKQPEKYARYGARMPKGVLLYGPPGTGKTLLARALAGEAGVPFYAVSGSDFVQLYVGVGASRVRELFKKARKGGKSVIFIDEIDAMAGKRGESSSDERDQTVNALLSEMSGFRTGEGVIVVAATNRLSSIDPALLRPGRFDRQIEVGLPGREEREQILTLHGKNKPMSDSVDLAAVAAMTPRFSGAALENLINEAAMLAARRDSGLIEMNDLRQAYRTIAAGSEKSGARGENRQIIALHEAGHALAFRRLMPEARLERVSILSTGGMAGYNLAIQKETEELNRNQILRQIAVSLAGRAAEEAILGSDAISSGASGDLERAAELAGAMVMRLGMDGESAASLATVKKIAGGQTGGEKRIRSLLRQSYDDALDLMRRESEGLLRVTAALLVREALSGEEVDRLLRAA